MISNPYVWFQKAHNKGVSCLLVGDINIQKRDDPSSAFRFVHNALSSADILYGNLEGCLYRPDKNDLPGKSAWQHSDESMVDALTSVGFDAVGCANNVIFGSEAIINTLEVLDKVGIAHCGAGKNRKSARMPVIIEKCGVRVGFIQFTARLHKPEQEALDDKPGVAVFKPDIPNDIEELCLDIKKLRSEVDILIFSHHLRKSCTNEIEPYQRKLARRCIEAGADIVYAHGAHVIQGIELWKGSPIFHCVGELAFDYPMTHSRKEGLLIRLLIEGGRIAGISALLCCRDADNTVYLVDPLESEGQEQLNRLRELSLGMSLPVNGGEIIVTTNRV